MTSAQHNVPRSAHGFGYDWLGAGPPVDQRCRAGEGVVELRRIPGCGEDHQSSKLGQCGGEPRYHPNRSQRRAWTANSPARRRSFSRRRSPRCRSAPRAPSAPRWWLASNGRTARQKKPRCSSERRGFFPCKGSHAVVGSESLRWISKERFCAIGFTTNPAANRVVRQ